MAKFWEAQNGDLYFYCPGCDQHHAVNRTWQFNGNFDNPTLSPSILVTRGGDPNYRCHSFVRDGKIEFLTDCSHQLAGKTVELEDIENIE